MKLKVLAIDGPGGAGKSTVAKACARALGLPYLDTGAMYRAATAAVLDAGLDPRDQEGAAAIVMSSKIDVGNKVLLNGVDITKRIRSHELTIQIPPVAGNPLIRADLAERQRNFCIQQGGGVVEGRDIGTVVFPDACLKIYLTADPAVRARRRSGETGEDFRFVAQALELRDSIDSNRSVAPLDMATDAILVDTTEMPLEDVVAKLIDLWRTSVLVK